MLCRVCRKLHPALFFVEVSDTPLRFAANGVAALVCLLAAGGAPRCARAVISIRSAISLLVAGGILIAAVAFGWFLDRGSEAALKRVLGQVLDREQADVLHRTSDFFEEPVRLLQWTASGLESEARARQPVETFRALRQMPRVDASGWFDTGSGELRCFNPGTATFEPDEHAIDATTLRALTAENPEAIAWSLPYVRGDARKVVSLVAVRVGRTPRWLWITFHLEALSTYLDAGQERSALVYVLDDRDRLVAFPPAVSRARFGWQLQTTAAEKWLLRSIAELDDHAARAFFSALREAEIAKRQTSPEPPTRFLWSFQQWRYFVSAFEVPQPNGARLKVYVAVAYEPLIGPIVSTLYRALAAAVAILAVFTGIAVWLGRRIDAQMLALAAEMEQVTQFRLDSRPVSRSRLKEITLLREGLEKMKAGLRSFQRYVPTDLVRELLSLGQEARIGGESRPLAVMFCDLAGFTNRAESLSPAGATALLADYFQLVERVVTAHHGTVDKYLGDGVMAFWGAPRALPARSQDACAAALAIVREASRAGVMLQIRVGIAEGPALVGNIGTPTRLNYTAIGAAVNLASRLEGVAKYYGAGILLSEAAALSARGAFKVREVDRVIVLGSEKPESVWELLTTTDDAGCDEMVASYGCVLSAYRDADFARARGLAERHRAAFPEDRVAVTLQRIIESAEKQPRETWKPVTRMEQK